MDKVVMRVEPSKEFSRLCGFPYFIEERFSVEEALANGLVNKEDIERMKTGEICKSIPIVKGE